VTDLSDLILRVIHENLAHRERQALFERWARDRIDRLSEALRYLDLREMNTTMSLQSDLDDIATGINDALADIEHDIDRLEADQNVDLSGLRETVARAKGVADKVPTSGDTTSTPPVEGNSNGAGTGPSGNTGPDSDPGTGDDMPDTGTGGVGDRPTGTPGPDTDPGTGHDDPSLDEQQPGITQDPADGAADDPTVDPTGLSTGVIGGDVGDAAPGTSDTVAVEGEGEGGGAAETPGAIDGDGAPAV
jgi:hypothetical protein